MNWVELLIPLGLAFVLGSIIGLERQWWHRNPIILSLFDNYP